MKIKKKMKLININKYNKNQNLISNLSVEINMKKITCVIGESGCGKTTLLKILFGSEKPDSGTIYIDDINITEYNYVDRGFKFVGQDMILFDYMNIYDNIMFGFSENCYLNNNEKIKKVNTIIEEIGLINQKYKYPNEISEGQKQRVVIIRAIIDKTKVLIMDEAFNRIDSYQKRFFMTFFKNYCKNNNITVILATHSLEEILFFNEDLMVIESGKIKEFDKVYEIIKNPKTKCTARLLNIHEIYFKQIKIMKDHIVLFSKNNNRFIFNLPKFIEYSEIYNYIFISNKNINLLNFYNDEKKLNIDYDMRNKQSFIIDEIIPNINGSILYLSHFNDNSVNIRLDIDKVIDNFKYVDLEIKHFDLLG